MSRVAGLRTATASVQRTATTTVTFTAATRRMLLPSPASASAGSFVNAADLATGLATGGTTLAAAPAAPPVKTRTKNVGFQILWVPCCRRNRSAARRCRWTDAAGGGCGAAGRV